MHFSPKIYIGLLPLPSMSTFRIIINIIPQNWNAVDRGWEPVKKILRSVRTALLVCLDSFCIDHAQKMLK